MVITLRGDKSPLDSLLQHKLDQTVLSQYVRENRAYSFMKNIRGSLPYYQRTFYDLLAMIRKLGHQHGFWPDMIQIIARQYGVYYTDDEVAALPFDEKSNWLKRNPVTPGRHFHYRLNVFSKDFLKSTARPLGEVVDYAIRIEFQARGSPHATIHHVMPREKRCGALLFRACWPSSAEHTTTSLSGITSL